MDEELKPIRLQRESLGKKAVVNEQTGLIENVSFISQGPALGHGFDVDETMLSQVKKLVNANGGVKVHLTHSHAESGFFTPGADGITTIVGKALNARIEAGQVRGDIQLGAYAAHSPAGDMRSFLLSLAKEQPDAVGLSIVFVPDKFEQRQDSQKQSLPPAGRVKELESVDFVGTPAANPNGLLSKGTSTKGADMTDLEKAEAASLQKKADEAKQAEALAKVKSDAEAQAVVLAEAKAKEAVKGERERVSEITKLGEAHKLEGSFVTEMINGGFNLSDVNKKVLEKLAERNKPVSRVNVKEDSCERAALREAIPQAIMLRSGVKVDKPHELATKYRYLGAADLCRQYYKRLGIDEVETMSRSQLWNMLSRNYVRDHYGHVALAQGTGDFGSILADTNGKTFRKIYEEKPKNWQICFKRATAPDFKTVSRTWLSEAPRPTVRPEGAAVVYTTLTDGQETYNLVEYTSGLCITRRAFINDDMDVWSKLPQLQANSCAGLEDDIAFAIFTANAAMADGGLLFNNTAVTTVGGHANYIASGGAAPTVASLSAIKKLMMKQKGPKLSARLNLRPKYLIVPTTLEDQSIQLIGSAVDPAKSNNTPNPHSNKMVVVSEPRLDDDSAAKWYVAADSNEVDTVEVCFLADEPEPQIASEIEFSTDDFKQKVRHSVASKAIDWRGLAGTAGA